MYIYKLFHYEIGIKTCFVYIDIIMIYSYKLEIIEIISEIKICRRCFLIAILFDEHY